MRRLIERGLMFDNLFEVGTPALVARYNSAMERLTGRRTELGSFHVDLSGYAPEIGDELGDPLYLNPNGCNRQFILLSPEQRKAPLLEAAFSASREILKGFIDDNRQTLFALTARDAVLGELEDSVWHLQGPEDLFELRTVRVVANTLTGILSDAARLRTLIAEMEEGEEAWLDEDAIQEMIRLARRVGDVRNQRYEIGRATYPVGNFFTTHFGGLWVFRSAALPAIIHLGPDPGTRGKASVFPLTDRKALMAFLTQNNLVETVEYGLGDGARDLIRARMDFILLDYLAKEGIGDLAALRPPDLRGMLHRFRDALPPEHAALGAALRELESGRTPGMPKADDPACFYRLRARKGPDRELVNHLLAALTPLEPRQLFICNKEAFYEAYRAWPEPKKDWVAEFLASDYLPDKAGRRAALYGPDPGADVPAPSPWGRRRSG